MYVLKLVTGYGEGVDNVLGIEIKVSYASEVDVISPSDRSGGDAACLLGNIGYPIGNSDMDANVVEFYEPSKP